MSPVYIVCVHTNDIRFIQYLFAAAAAAIWGRSSAPPHHLDMLFIDTIVFIHISFH